MKALIISVIWSKEDTQSLHSYFGDFFRISGGASDRKDNKGNLPSKFTHYKG